jgi:hypothetical protein
MTSFATSGLIRRATSALFWLVTIAAILFMAQVFLAVDGRSDSVSDTLLGCVPLLGCYLSLVGLDCAPAWAQLAILYSA